jgi:hypothetical protein
MRERDDEVTALLKRARGRVADPEHWTKEAYATTEFGGRVAPRSPRASRWCAVGALQAELEPVRSSGAKSRRGAALVFRAAYGRLQEAVFTVAQVARPPGGARDPQVVERFNDRLAVRERGHEALLAVFDEAIRAK